MWPRTSQVVLVVKNLHATADDDGDRGLIPGWGKSPIHPRILAWRIPWTEEAGGLQSMRSQRVRHDWSMHMEYKGVYAVAAKSLQSCLTVCDPIDGSPPGSPVPGILQARTLEWVAISFSNACKWKVKVKSLSRVQLLATPRTTRLLHPWDFPVKSTGVGCHCLLQRGI